MNRETTINTIPFSTIRNVLFLRLRSLGDCVLMTPGIRALKEQYPHLSLSVLVERPFRDVFLDNPLLDEVLVLERGGGPLRTLAQRAVMAGRLRRRRFDLVLNYHGGSTSLFLMSACRAAFRVGDARYRNPGRYTHLLRDPERFFGGRPLHTVEYQLAMLLHVGLAMPDPLPDPEIHIPPAVTAAVRERLAAQGLAPGKYIHVHPTATLSTKQWPPDRFAALIRGIRETFEHPVVLTCGPGEESTIHAILAGLDRPAPWFSDLSIKELAAVTADAEAFIGCDSGPAHIAAALKTRVCVIFGSSNARAWHPWNTPHRLVKLPFTCNPCPGYRCEAYEEPRCILDIQPAVVLDAFYDLMR